MVSWKKSLTTQSSKTINLTVNALDSKDVLSKLEELKRPLAEMLNGTNQAYGLNAGLGV